MAPCPHPPRGVQSTQPHVHLAAIDNGLAFPYKHPDMWRSYPYGWLSLPISTLPFTEETRQHFLTLLTNTSWFRETIKELRSLFERDVDFSERMWEKQVAVMRGQIHNLIVCLKKRGYGPAQLCDMPNIVVWEETIEEQGPPSPRNIASSPDSPRQDLSASAPSIPRYSNKRTRKASSLSDAERGHQTDGEIQSTRRSRGSRIKRRVVERFELLKQKPWFTWW